MRRIIRFSGICKVLGLEYNLEERPSWGTLIIKNTAKRIEDVS